MRKNFFKKKLASTLALAMVVTSLAMPTNASAATATKIVKQGGAAAPTVLYVGEKGTDYGLSKVVKGNKYTWTTSNSKIATINKSGVVTAKAPGKVTIKVTARDSKGKWLSAFTQKLTINQRATSIDIGADDFKLLIGQNKDLNAVKTPAKSTDVVKYVSDNTAVATVNAKTGVVKAVGVGEATITVLSKATSSSADSSKYNKKDTVKVTVADGIQSIKQTTPTKFDVTFATDQSKTLTASDLTVTDSDGVKQIIKSLSFSADGKTATVEVYIDLSNDVTYKVAFGTSEKTFVASKGDVASVVLEGKTVQYAKPTTIGVKLLDKNGVDVTTAEKLNYVTFEFDNSDAYIGVNSDGKYEIQVYNFPKSVSVTATYHTYKYTDGVETSFKSTAVFNSVEEIKDTASDIAYTVAPFDDGADWTAVKTSVPATAYDYQVFIKAKDGNGDDLDQTNFSFESSDTSILSVSKEGAIYPVKAGSAYVKATYGATTKMLAITVGAESKVVNVTPDNSFVTFYYVNDAKNGVTRYVDPDRTISLTAKDQYDNTVSGNSITNVEALNSDLVPSKASSPIASADVTGNKIKFTAGVPVNSNNDGSYNYRLTYEGKPVVVTVKFVEVKDSVVSFVNFETKSTTLDAVIGSSTDSSTDKQLSVYGYNTSGQPVIKYTTGVTFTTTLDGDSYVGPAVVTDAGTATVVALDYDDAAGVATQAAVGTYLVKASVDVDGKSSTPDKTATSTVIIKNTQAIPTVKLDDSSIDAGKTYLDTLDEAYTVKAGNTELDIIGATIVESNKEVKVDLATNYTTANKNLVVKKLVVKQIVTTKGGAITVSRTINVNAGYQYISIK